MGWAFAGSLALAALLAPAQTLDWNQINQETLQHFQALVRINGEMGGKRSTLE